MLTPTKASVLKRGVPLNKVITYYHLVNFNSYFSQFFGLNRSFMRIFYYRLERQFLESSLKVKNTLNDTLLLNIINFTFISILPPLKLLTDIRDFILIRHVIIKSYKGKRLMSSRPISGQRSWSNSKTTRKMNKSIRSFVINYRLGEKKLTLKQARARKLALKESKKPKKKRKLVKRRIPNTWIFYVNASIYFPLL